MLRKRALIGFCFLLGGLNASAFATYGQGIYFSLGTGVQSMQSSSHSLISIKSGEGQLTALEPTNFDFNEVNSDYFAELGLGAGRFINHWYLAVQGDYQVFSGQGGLSFSKAQIPAIWGTSVNYTENTRILNQYTLSGMLGYRWQTMLGFLRLGYVNAGARHNAHVSFHDSLHRNVTSYFSPTLNERLQGYEIGLGARLPLIHRMDLNMEYDFILYGPEEFTDSAIVTQFDHPLIYSTHSRQNIQSQSVKCSLIYHF